MLDEIEVDGPQDDQVLVRIDAVGLCHTDISTRAMLTERLLPAVLGHEGAGVVEAVGSRVRGVGPGDHVVCTFRSCGSCTSCTTGAPAYCTARGLNSLGGRAAGTSALTRRGERLNGGFFGQSSFARYALAYESNVVTVPAGVPAGVAAPLGCSVQTGAGAVLNVLRPTAGEPVVVLGTGAVGMAAVMAAVASGADVIAVDPVASRRTLAVELGARAALDPVDDPVGAVRDLTDGGAACAVDTTGRPEVVASALDLLGPRGRLAVLGIGQSFPVEPMTLMSKGITVRGVIEGDSVPEVFIPRLLALHADGRLPLERIITRMPFETIEDAVAASACGDVIKPVLTFG